MRERKSPQRILLLEDDPNLGFILQEQLELHGYTVTRCANGMDGTTAYRKGGFILCLVDVMMPKKDGFTFAREVRQGNDETPIIFLTAKSLKEDRIEGFKAGGDDYVTKPFSMEELMLRVQAVLKRSRPDITIAEEPKHFTIGSYSLDAERQILERKGKQQRLTPKEADLLTLLCLHMNRILEREVALKRVWGDDSYFAGRSMDVFVSRLRRHLKGDPRIEIMNVHGKGFKLVVGE